MQQAWNQWRLPRDSNETSAVWLGGSYFTHICCSRTEEWRIRGQYSKKQAIMSHQLHRRTRRHTPLSKHQCHHPRRRNTRVVHVNLIFPFARPCTIASHFTYYGITVASILNLHCILLSCCCICCLAAICGCLACQYGMIENGGGLELERWRTCCPDTRACIKNLFDVVSSLRT